MKYNDNFLVKLNSNHPVSPNSSTPSPPPPVPMPAPFYSHPSMHSFPSTSSPLPLPTFPIPSPFQPLCDALIHLLFCRGVPSSQI